MGIPLRLLILEDSEDDAELLLLALESGGYDVVSRRAQSAEGMKKALQEEQWDIIISDFSMPSFSAIDALDILKRTDIDIPFIIVSGTVGEDTAVKAMKSGAHDYLMKGNLLRLAPLVQRELSDAEERRKTRKMENELREKNEQLLQSQKMEAIGILAGGIAHDFNNMLGAILLLCEAAADELDKPDCMANYFTQISKAAEHAAILTRQLLIYSRKQAVEPKVLDLNEEVAEAENMLRRILGEAVEFKVIPQSSLGNIFFDRVQVGQLIMNLAINARDAMPKGGELVIETKAELVETPQVTENGLMPAGKYSVLIVRDTGCGMDEKTKSRIFEPFFTTKGVNKGTGLGLTTVYGIVERNSGFITVESELGKGTEFSIYMPVTDRPLDEIGSDKMVGDISGEETILVVEDQKSLRNSISLALSKAGYKVLEAEGGREALALIKDYRDSVHLMITDLIMPEMNGAELAKTLRENRADIKVIYMSGYHDENVTKPGDAPAGTVELLEEPFSSLALLRKVKGVLRPKIEVKGE